MLTLELFNVIDEFFRRTSAWRYYEDIALEEGSLEYGFSVPAQSVVVRLLAVTHSEVPVPSAVQVGAVQSSVGRLDSELVFPDGDSEFHPTVSDIDVSNVFSYAIYRPGYISITTAPDAEARKYPLRVCLALSVAPSCIECDCDDWDIEEWCWDTFFQAWLDGTLGRLYGMPSKPWSNPTIAVYHGRRFRNAMAYRKQEAIRGFSYNLPAWRFPRGWG
jgi:hypothetical protein